MSGFKRGIILKDGVYLGKDIVIDNVLKELGIEDTKENRRNVFVEASISPKKLMDFSSNVDDWDLHIFQEETPEWFDFETEKNKMKQEVKNWLRNHAFINQSDIDIEIQKDEVFLFKDCSSVKLTGRGRTILDSCKNVSVNDRVFSIFTNSVDINLFNDTNSVLMDGSMAELHGRHKIFSTKDSEAKSLPHTGEVWISKIESPYKGAAKNG